MWLKVHHPRLAGQGLYEHPDIRERVFLTSIEVVEFGCLLEINENTAKWAWLFRTYMQWHAVAHVLSELAVRGPGPETDRAWRAVEAVYEDSLHAKRQRGMLWKPIRQLYGKAMANRQRLSKSTPDPKFETQGFMQGEQSAVAAAANALGIDFQETSLLPAPQNFTNFTSPELEQQLSPDLMNWDDWDPLTTGAQPIYPFSYTGSNSNTNIAQEWF